MGNDKHIFIGLGGSGCQTVAQIKEKVYAKRFPHGTATKSRLQAMNDKYRFLFLDTDSRDIEEANKRNRESFEHGKVPFISPQTDLIALGRANPQAIYYEAEQDPDTLINKRILEACSKELSVKIPDQPLQFGAGAFRMKSRISFAHSLTDFQTKVQAAIAALNDVKTVGGEDCTIFYWVVCSTLGGTGSGIFNDVLYHLNQLHRQIVGDGDPQLVLTMYMPKVYVDSNATEEKYALNAFGVFKELSAFKTMSYNKNQNTVMHRMAFANDYNLIDGARRYCPFYYLIPIDVQTDKGTSLGNTRTMYRNTAEMLYHLHAGQGGDTFRSDIDNYMNDIMERNHENFLVPMGYVSLQKPNEQFDKYFATRFKRDVFRTWMLNENEGNAELEDSTVDKLYNEFFKYFETSSRDLIKKQEAIETLVESIDVSENQLPEDKVFMSVSSEVENVTSKIQSENKQEKKAAHIQKLNESIWAYTETLIKEHGIIYAIKAIDAVKSLAKKKYEEFNGDIKSDVAKSKDERKQLISELRDAAEKASQEAEKETTIEKIKKSNKEDIEAYRSAVQAWYPEAIKFELDKWKFDILRDFCNDDKNDELSKLRKHVTRIEDKAKEMSRESVKSYGNLANAFGNTALDVTTVYLPMLKDICDGDGWIQGNFFSKLYQTIINAQPDKQETPDRKDLTDFIVKNVYLTPDEKMREEIKKGQYLVVTREPDPKRKGQEISTEEIRFFTCPELDRDPEKILEDFVRFAQEQIEKASRNSKEIQDKWVNKKISSFFNDLTNDQKDEVRKSLNPALFFNYNNQRIDVVKKEEHIVFVAGSEELAHEMLSYEKGNPKHRFESSDNENTALVLKSKFGLSLEDYRMYDSLKMVYDKASFREKYHFHHDFAQFGDKITLEDLPDEILEQHRTFARILMLDMFRKELSNVYYKDEYDSRMFSDSMFIMEKGDIKLARPEAFGIKKNQVAIRVEDNGRILFQEISGSTFAEQFAKYSDLYYNHRYGETLNGIILAITRSNIQVADAEGNMVTAETLMKNEYAEKRDALLHKLCDQKNDISTDASDRRLYNILFNLIREKYETFHDFIGK